VLDPLVLELPFPDPLVLELPFPDPLPLELLVPDPLEVAPLDDPAASEPEDVPPPPEVAPDPALRLSVR
jgi:hypothetical protein